ncbi:MAG: GFA family protein [Myxococcota bacterium]|nr:GFA family protein [Myxococcota bacterium]
MSGVLRGGCFCGEVRFEITGLFDAGYCHCTLCRRFSGGPAVAWANAPSRGFRLLRGAPRRYRSSPHWERAFCTTCGAPVYQQVPRPPADGSDLLCVLLGSLDDPTAVRPTAHIFCRSRLPWFEVDDDLPRFPDGALSHPSRRRSWRTDDLVAPQAPGSGTGKRERC